MLVLYLMIFFLKLFRMRGKVGPVGFRPPRKRTFHQEWFLLQNKNYAMKLTNFVSTVSTDYCVKSYAIQNTEWAFTLLLSFTRCLRVRLRHVTECVSFQVSVVSVEMSAIWVSQIDRSKKANLFKNSGSNLVRSLVPRCGSRFLGWGQFSASSAFPYAKPVARGPLPTL